MNFLKKLWKKTIRTLELIAGNKTNAMPLRTALDTMIYLANVFIYNGVRRNGVPNEFLFIADRGLWAIKLNDEEFLTIYSVINTDGKCLFYTYNKSSYSGIPQFSFDHYNTGNPEYMSHNQICSTINILQKLTNKYIFRCEYIIIGLVQCGKNNKVDKMVKTFVIPKWVNENKTYLNVLIPILYDVEGGGNLEENWYTIPIGTASEQLKKLVLENKDPYMAFMLPENVKLYDGSERC